MQSIVSLGHPLAFKTDYANVAAPEIRSEGPTRTYIRTEVRALEGMQKEAIVHDAASDTVWRMVSDEGPYLNGTDLAPFPLGFFTAGMAFSFMSEILKHANAHDTVIAALNLTQDNRYTMEGSAIRGDMTARAIPVELSVEIEADASEEALVKIVSMAEATSPAHAYMRNSHESAFAVSVNGNELDVTKVKRSSGPLCPDPDFHFDKHQPLEGQFMSEIITKDKAAETTHGEGGAGSSLKAEQKRTLHVRADACLLNDTLKEVKLTLFKPHGSSFSFRSDETSEMGGQGEAPPALAYLTAGVGFCFMTQLGRYATIVKQDLTAYRIVQDNIFNFNGDPSDWSASTTAESVDTHVFVDFDESDEAGEQLVKMGQQTCFLHAAMAASYPTNLTAKVNGSEVSF